MRANLSAFSDYWFGKFEDPSRWFYEGFHYDHEIERFRALWASVVHRELLPETISEHLLVIVIIDQLPRHLYRGRAEAYAWDPRALELARGLYERGWHTALSTWEFIFWTVVFEHSEELSEHTFARMRLRERIAGPGTQSEDRLHLEKARLYLDKHSEVIRAFGRYPKRAEVRGLPLTDAEREYLAGRAGKPY